MQDNAILNWMFIGGFASVPKRLFALMEPLGLSFNEIGALAYILSLEGDIKDSDKTTKRAIEVLIDKQLIHWDEKGISLDPLVQRLSIFLGLSSSNCSNKDSGYHFQYAAIVKEIEKETASFLSEKDREGIMLALQKYNWTPDLVLKVYLFYIKNKRRIVYEFSYFSELAYLAGVANEESFSHYLKNIDLDYKKVKEVLYALGKYNNPTKAQKEMYGKWQRDWNFSHEMIMKATNETINANNPSIGYLDKVLESWFHGKVLSLSDLEKYKENEKRFRSNHTKKNINNRSFKNSDSVNLNFLLEE